MSTTATPETLSLADFAGTYRFSVAKYHQLADVGILGESDAVELLDGYIVLKGGLKHPLRPACRREWSGLRRFTVPEYEAMIDAGILKSGEPVELIDGILVLKMSRNPPHDAAIDLFRAAIAPHLASGLLLRSQQAITVLDGVPESDFAIVRGHPRAFAKKHPRPSEILLVVEVSDSSLDVDRQAKQVMYAKNRLPVYWIVNLIDQQIEVYGDPDSAATPPRYLNRTDYVLGQNVPFILDGVEVAQVPVADLMP